jgi:hypothetical protein
LGALAGLLPLVILCAAYPDFFSSYLERFLRAGHFLVTNSVDVAKNKIVWPWHLRWEDAAGVPERFRSLFFMAMWGKGWAFLTVGVFFFFAFGAVFLWGFFILTRSFRASTSRIWAKAFSP